MADGGDDVPVAPAAPAVMDVQGALKAVLRAAHFQDGLAKGLHEAAKALDKREAHFCVLAENCDEPMYTKLVEALCNEHEIPLIKVADKKLIGEWCGLCKYDKEGKARKVVGCSCAVVKSWGNEDQGKVILTAYFNRAK
uniref:40S ribosomal protein S12 n=1 Tax=Aceria tosichella TaxID=561515 RepID=A0A6G1SHV6_9ACAR